MPEFIEGEPQSLIAQADELATYKLALTQLGDKAPKSLTNLLTVINQSAFIAGVLHERAAIMAEIDAQNAAEAGHDTYPQPVTCFRDDHVVNGEILCAKEGVGPCNGFPREHNCRDDDCPQNPTG